MFGRKRIKALESQVAKLSDLLERAIKSGDCELAGLKARVDAHERAFAVVNNRADKQNERIVLTEERSSKAIELNGRVPGVVSKKYDSWCIAQEGRLDAAERAINGLRSVTQHNASRSKDALDIAKDAHHDARAALQALAAAEKKPRPCKKSKATISASPATGVTIKKPRPRKKPKASK